MKKRNIPLYTGLWIIIFWMNNVYASVDSPLPYLYNVYKGNVTNVNISSFEGCCPSDHMNDNGNGGEVISQSIWKDSKKHLNLIIKNINAYTYQRDWNDPNNRRSSQLKDVKHKSYNLKQDLWLPDIKDMDFLFEVGFNEDGKSHSWFNTNNTWHARDWNYSIYETENEGNTSYYNLYTWNGKKWGICKPYYIMWDNRILGGNKLITFFNWSNIWIFWNKNWPGDENARGDVWNDKKYIFYFPFSVNSSGEIKKSLNIVSWNWHLNWKLAPEDIQLKFSFY